MLAFESSVIPYGEKTMEWRRCAHNPFESSVIPYGEKTVLILHLQPYLFESSVIPYGEKTSAGDTLAEL